MNGLLESAPTMTLPFIKDDEAQPQPIGDFRPVDEWQTHINRIFYGLRGRQVRDFFQTFASADYRLAHALAADYHARVLKREQATPSDVPLTVVELGCGNGNLAACFLTHLRAIDTHSRVYPRVRYVLVDVDDRIVEAALAHPDLAPHRTQVETKRGELADLKAFADGSVDRLICNERWNELATKLILKKQAEFEEEFLRPNVSVYSHAAITDWTGFLRAVESCDWDVLRRTPPFLEDLVWEREYHKVEWNELAFRKTITDWFKKIEDEVMVPVNIGAHVMIQEAMRVLAPTAVGFSAFDAGTEDLDVLNDPEKPCSGQYGGLSSFLVNFALARAVATYAGAKQVKLEPHREFVGQSLGLNVMSLMDLLATHPEAGDLKPWEQDRLVIMTIRALNQTYRSLYERTIDFPLRKDMPAGEREALQDTLRSLKGHGVPDTVAYLSEDELTAASRDLEALGYDQEFIKVALTMPPQQIDYSHFFFARR